MRDLLTPKKLFDMDIFELANAIVVPAVYGLKNSTIKEMYFVELANGVGGKIFTIPGGYLPLFTKDIIPQKPLENSTNNIFSVNANMFDHFTKYHYLTRCKDLFDVLKTIDLLEFDDMKTFDYQFPKDFDLQDCNNQTILATMPNESDNLTASVGLMGEVYPLREISLIKNAPSQSDFKILYNYAPYSVIIPSSKLSSTTLHTDTGNYKLTSGTNQTFLIDTF